MPDKEKDDELIRRWTKAITVKVREGNRVQYLIDGPNTFKEMYEAILTTFPYADSSGYYIYLLGWWLDDTFPLTGKSGSSIAALFRQASLRKVQIRVMLWDQAGSQNTDQIKRVNELPTGAGILDNNTLYLVGAHHQKVLIVKGQRGLIGFCGGIDINIDRVQAVERQKGSPMHDVHCKIEGDAVHDLVDVFVQRWQAHPDHRDLDKRKGLLLGLADRTPPGSKPKEIGSQFVAIARTFNFVGNGKKCAKEHSIRSTMIGAIRAARRFIYIEDQYLVNFEAAEELKEALKNIQHLTILIPHSSISDLPHVWWARAQFISILRHGNQAEKKVRVFYLVTPGPKPFGEHTYVHAKTWIFDDQLAVIGSANCNERGWSSDSEVAAAIFDTTPSVYKFSFAQKLRMQLWEEHLGVKVVDGGLLESADQWLKASTSPTSKVRLYNPDEGQDSGSSTNLDWNSQVDPSADDLSSCQEVSTVAR
ncbi:MAG: phospholipase D-like domain-containing protein [Ktedonobacteraceae bacterium]